MVIGSPEAALALLRRQRSQYHLTLGEAIDVLRDVAPRTRVVLDFNQQYPRRLHSYRGYYEDLALAWTPEPVGVQEFVQKLREALGETFEGCKGGTYVMGPDTPLWAAEVSCTGRCIVAARTTLLDSQPYVVLETQEDN